MTLSKHGTSGRRDAGPVTAEDIALLKEGRHFRLYEVMGAHPAEHEGESGVRFAVWAPGAESVAVFGDFNGWNKESRPLAQAAGSGVWEGFIPGAAPGAMYKYHIRSKNGRRLDKADPFAFGAEMPPGTASVVRDLEYEWGDGEWMRNRGGAGPSAPASVYEVHLGSWMRVPEEGDRFPTYRELAPKLAEYVLKTGFTHVELLPVMEHPFYGSWGYQCTGYFAPTSRYGSPEDFMYLVDHLHRNGIGVILDWVPSHFPDDAHGLSRFDGTHLFEHEDPRRGVHPEWNSRLFNYGRNEVVAFLLSSALFWLDRYHVDGLRVDAVATMLSLDDFRKDGEWIPNEYGGRENLDGIAFLQRFNEVVHEQYPGVVTIAEESTAWPKVSRPVREGGLGFDMKWDMGWTHDTLFYMSLDPIRRSHHHDMLTFRMMYAFDENFVLSLSHDDVSCSSLLERMPGDDWSKFANLRLLLGYLYAQPGKKLLFMGDEIGQWRGWSHDRSLDWHLLENPLNKGLQRWVEDLNQFYRRTPAMHGDDFSPEGFRWIDCHDARQSTLALMRSAASGPQEKEIVVVCNFTPVPRPNHRIGVPREGIWREQLNSDASEYGGSNQGSMGDVEASPIPAHGLPFSVNLLLPPLGIVFLEPAASS
jgi:1,4-alpha-glucan branching enzyme